MHPTQGTVTAHRVGFATIVATVGPTAGVGFQVQVLTLKFVALASGNLTSCGLTEERGVYCWGRNVLGVPDSNYPFRLPQSAGRFWAGVDVGFDYACAFELPGPGPAPAGGLPVRCWGVNITGQLGSGALSQFEATPQTVAGGMTFVQIALGNEHACGVRADGTAWCWGNDGDGELGDGPAAALSCTSWITNTPTPCSAVPVRVGGAQDMRFSSVDAYYTFSCGTAVSPTPGVFCWGRNHWGQLGNGTTIPSDAPVQVNAAASGVTLRDARVGQFHACALGSDSRVYCWGGNGFAQLGRGNLPAPQACPAGPCATQPVPANGGFTYQSLTVGRDHSCGIASGPGGIVRCWGGNLFGQSGDAPRFGGVVNEPIHIAGTNTYQFRQVEAGRQGTCGVAFQPGINRDVAFCWGLGNWGQLGSGVGSRGTGPSVPGPVDPVRHQF